MPMRVGCRADDADKHANDVTSLIFTKGKLYSGGDDGKVIAWSSDLTKQAQVQSNPCSVYSVTASDDTLYSSSNEGTVKAFELGTLKEKLVVVQDAQSEFWKVLYANGHLYTGDHEGNIKVWNNNAYYGVVNVAESVKDLVVYKDLVFSAKDLDLIITDIKLGGEKLQYGTVKSFDGRAPITLVGDKYFAFLSREGTDILIHDLSHDAHYNEVTRIKGAGEKIVNALAGGKWNDKLVIFSGGWDKNVKKWVIEGGVAKLDSTLDVEIVVNAITLGETGEIYVGGSDGHIVSVEVE